MVISSTLRALAWLSTALLMTASVPPTHAANESDQSMTDELIAAAERGETSRVREILTDQPNLLNVAGITRFSTADWLQLFADRSRRRCIRWSPRLASWETPLSTTRQTRRVVAGTST